MKTFFKKVYHNYLKFPLYILFHPFDGYDDFKRGKKGSLIVAIIFILLFAFLRIIEYQYSGFIVSDFNPKNLNSLKELIATILIVFLFVVGNWSVTTLMNGKGSAKEIFMVTGYSLLPMILIGFPTILVSNLITLDEVGLYSLIKIIAIVLTAWMLFMGMLNIHEYGLFKTLAAFLFTILSMAAMIFVGLLFFDLIQQFITFIKMIWQELSLRY
ncbi:MAG: Yip1 family protein [Acholeplasmatales bacterium]|jgi:hypothetical protein|nr:YIP1 family protein [Acholeplasmataceae bacterium]MCK9233716.1 YIP1 family protein [Acholeplasmataceae bacterium]MCK9289544.1 YIP1 family protein [Acholeplasmataceae bacterium]MCK9427596.1 YIP1 family protein [Acholeplasmataceae bacterium]MDY0115434.1 Yip1 family protein [Acholeplasmatales bacterium]